MAQNITIMGASYSNVPAVQLPKTGGGTARFDDASVTTATASDVASGKVFLASDGKITTGTSSGGGGASSWTKVAETSYRVSTTRTSSADVATWATGHRELWNSDKMVYVRIRDTEGTKDGYFFGTDNLFWNSNAISSGASSSTVSGRVCIKNLPGNEGLSFYASSSATGYGVFADTIYSDGRIRIRKRYNSSYSLTIDGTYKIEVYIIDYPIPFYE